MIAALALTAFAMDLDGARVRATERALAVELAAAERDAARGATTAATTDALPAVSLFASANTGAGLTAFGFERPVAVQLGAGVQASWALIAPTTWAAATASRRTARGRDALLAWARVTARHDATSAYADAWSAARAVEAMDRSAADARQGADAVAQHVAAGLLPPVDGARAEADARAAEALAVESAGAVGITCAALQALLAEPVTGVCALEPPVWSEPGTGGSHPALIAVEEALDAARSGRAGAVGGALPTLTLDATAATYAADGNVGPGWSAGAVARLPLDPGVGGDVHAASARLRAATALRANQARDLERARVASEAQHAAALAGLTARVAARSAAEQAWSLVDSRFAAGLLPLTDWLAARRALQDARVAEVRAEAALGAALADLEAARGVTAP